MRRPSMTAPRGAVSGGDLVICPAMLGHRTSKVALSGSKAMDLPPALPWAVGRYSSQHPRGASAQSGASASTISHGCSRAARDRRSARRACSAAPEGGAAAGRAASGAGAARVAGVLRRALDQTAGRRPWTYIKRGPGRYSRSSPHVSGPGCHLCVRAGHTGDGCGDRQPA
jgi:hypothetical protein